MKIQAREYVVYVYHEEDEILAILGADKNSTMYRISGWFGEKLFELLEGELTFDNLPPESQETFSRLIVTLNQKGLLAPFESDSTSVPFAPEEWAHFGTENFTGSLAKENASSLEQNEFTAQAETNDLNGFNNFPDPQPYPYPAT